MISPVCDQGAHAQCSLKNCECACHPVTASKVLDFIEKFDIPDMKWTDITELIDIDKMKKLYLKVLTDGWSFAHIPKKWDGPWGESRSEIEKREEETLRERTRRKIAEMDIPKGRLRRSYNEGNEEEYPDVVNKLHKKITRSTYLRAYGGKDNAKDPSS